MDAPTAAEVQDWTELEALKGKTPVQAERLVAMARSTFYRITGQKLDLITDVDLIPSVQQAIQGLTEMLTLQNSAETLDTMADFDLIKSFTAGPYSETRRDAGDAMKARMLVAWPWLSDLLWSLLTPEKYDYWLAFFNNGSAPAFEVTEMDWGAYEDVPLGGGWVYWDRNA